MKKIALLLLVFTSAPLPQAQSAPKDLPTPEQCSADLHAWYPNRHADAEKLRADDLETRVGEISSCSGMAASALPEYESLTDDALKYDTLVDTYEHSYTERLFHFIQRHGELAEFSKDDADGKR